ncbi:MAG: SPASM domain-containing protein, partial [Clostridia bacterium]|nr:SPASM domain-containing protein [Clostridia bacterium]
LEYGEKFDWPDLTAPERNARFCMGLRDQIGVLWEGTVVPCCLDAEGAIPLGNIFTDDLSDILTSPRAKAIYDGFSQGRAVEPLCRRCGYAERFG